MKLRFPVELVKHAKPGVQKHFVSFHFGLARIYSYVHCATATA